MFELGYGSGSIEHRLKTGRLHRLWPGVYAVGRPHVEPLGRLLAAVLYCGPHALLSHQSAAGLWGIRPLKTERIEVSVPLRVKRRPSGVVVHRRAALGRRDARKKDGIPVTSPLCTLIDLATVLDRESLETAVNEADKRGLITPEALRSALDRLPPRPGTKALRELLDRDTFALTDSELEGQFLAVVREAGLPLPETGRQVNGFRVDFYWPELALVVETDGLRYQPASERSRPRPSPRRRRADAAAVHPRPDQA